MVVGLCSWGIVCIFVLLLGLLACVWRLLVVCYDGMVLMVICLRV